MDLTGSSEARRGRVEDHLRANGYRNAPITTWFGDFAFIISYHRAVATGNREAARMLRTSYVQAAMFHLANHASAGRATFGGDIPYIFLLHGSPIAMDCLPEIITRFTECGVRFVSLDHAMRDIHHRSASPAAEPFRNHLQRYAMAAEVEMARTPPDLVTAILDAAPMDGPYGDSVTFCDGMLQRIYTAGGTTYYWTGQICSRKACSPVLPARSCGHHRRRRGRNCHDRMLSDEDSAGAADSDAPGRARSYRRVPQNLRGDRSRPLNR
jgi:hypothetical protein